MSESLYSEAPQGASPVDNEEERLLQAALERREWDLAIEMYEERAQKSRDPKVIGNAYKAAAKLSLQGLGHKDRARVYYEMAREQQKGDPEILDPLAELYTEAGRLDEARNALERLVKARAPKENPKELPAAAEDLRRLGRLSLKTGERAQAVKYYREAFEYDPVDRETLLQLADLNHSLNEGNQADIFEKALLYHHRTEIGDEKRAEILTRAGMRRLDQGNRPLAMLKLLTALEVAPNLKGPREAVVQLYTKEQSWPDVITHRKALTELLSSAPERAQNWREIGEVYLHFHKDEERALQAFREALKAAPTERSVIVYLKKFHAERGEWQEVTKLTEQLAELGRAPREKAELYEELSKLHAEKRRDKRAAVLALHKALDADPSLTRTFDALNQHLVELGDLAGLEESFRRMISRVGANAQLPIQIALLIGLGSVCREARKRREAAEAFEQVVRLEPQNPNHRETLAGIYQEDPATIPKAIEQHRALLQADPNRTSSLHALFDLYRQVDQDHAFLLAGTLSFLGGTRPDVVSFHNERKSGLKRARGKISDELWNRYLAHPQEDAFLSELFKVVGPYAAQLYARAAKDLNLKKADRLEIPKNEDLAFAKALKYVCDVLELEYPELYVPKGNLRLEFPATLPPSVVIGKDNLTGVTGQELQFILGKTIAYLRPAYLLLHQLQGAVPEVQRQLAEARMVYLSILQIAAPEIPIPPTERPRIEAFSPRLRKVLPPELVRRVGDFLLRRKAEAERADIVRWVAHAELATNRVGFVLAGELRAASRMIDADPRVGQMTPREKLQDLVFYSYSDQHARLREALGLTIAS
jgi:tetratricopeptide (TPR) repeat protein